MIGKTIQTAGLVCAALFTASGAQAVVYNLNFTAIVGNGTFSTGGNSQFYSLALGDDGLSGTQIMSGDQFNFIINLDQLLNVPSVTSFALAGVNIRLNQQLADPDDPNDPNDGDPATSSSSITLNNGTFAGETRFVSCANCVFSAFGVGPNTPFNFSSLSSSITIETLLGFSPNENGPFLLNDFELYYQATDAENAVPEPATWAMMIGGFGLVGGAMRRRRGQVSTAVRYG